ncbi:hypothetical protein, variant [Aphanomyces astaci]|uniref:Phospholipid/glycerol acyltransferase domain-containing protein n=1 Tax=Aphanomyces astaci TaxID=112090 RepID=W4G361_APHAT|nr:hypothetical protein, variant [Aphanomyces astaci]ETV73494.1 hypothetical protein, variant [Aphanomyces astaci]|eukprot:XP_009836920.1 hypothetical protein, variant [Aphanomyces astaci]
MEKYSRWSDLTTGINPFVPPPHQLPANAILRWTQVFFGGILALLRWILLFPLVLGLVLLSAVHTILDHVPFLGRVIHRATDWIVLGLILVVTTIFIKDEAANARRLGLLTPGTKPPALGGIKAGDVIVANHSSVLDILYFGFRYSPVFVFPCASDASKNLVQTFGLLGAFAQAMAPPLTSLTRPVKLQDVLRRTSSPVVVFPEGTRSNGKAVLTFLPILDSLPPPTRVHLVAIRYYELVLILASMLCTSWSIYRHRPSLGIVDTNPKRFRQPIHADRRGGISFAACFHMRTTLSKSRRWPRNSCPRGPLPSNYRRCWRRCCAPRPCT